MKILTKKEVAQLNGTKVKRITSTFDVVVNKHQLSEQINTRGNIYPITTAGTYRKVFTMISDNILKVVGHHFEKRYVNYYEIV